MCVAILSAPVVNTRVDVASACQLAIAFFHAVDDLKHLLTLDTPSHVVNDAVVHTIGKRQAPCHEPLTQVTRDLLYRVRCHRVFVVLGYELCPLRSRYVHTYFVIDTRVTKRTRQGIPIFVVDICTNNTELWISAFVDGDTSVRVDCVDEQVLVCAWCAYD